MDDSPAPVAELERIYDLWEYNFMVEAYLAAGGEPEKAYALAIVERVLAEKGDDAETCNACAWALASHKAFPEKAVAIATRAYELSPDDPNIMDTLAEAYYAAGDFKNAAAWEKKALDREPKNGFFQEQLKKFKAACEGGK